ncbi:MAG: hypothetical protein ACKVVT_03715 [Dehalococcoidia bacterium]
MMFARAAVLMLALVLGALGAGSGAARADDGDAARLAASSVFIGQRAGLTIEVVAPAGATVELDPLNEAWAGVEVVRLGDQTEEPVAGGVLHRIELVVAPFRPGAGAFRPAVVIVQAGEVTPRLLPELRWEVVPTLPDDAPLELTPLAAAREVAGAESPFLKPGLALAAIAAVVALALGCAGIVRWVRSRPPKAVAAAPVPFAPVDLGSAESSIDRDPVGAYRSLAVYVRTALGRRYAFPAHAMTTHELKSRMESFGVDRWQARLVTGLLEECDAVVYAGYRPAAERRQADLTMAREIVEAVT